MEKNFIRKKAPRVILYIALTVIIVVGAIILSKSVFVDHTSYTHADDDRKSVISLYCHSTDTVEGFFDLSEATSVKHEIKILFDDKSASDIMYTLEAIFADTNTAQTQKVLYHSKYNNTMSANNIDTELLAPTFSVKDEKVKINFYSNARNVGDITGQLFYLDSEEIKGFRHSSIKALTDIYKKKGFLCK